MIFRWHIGTTFSNILYNNILENREEKKPSTDCIIEGLKICLKNNNSVFAGEHLLQTNGTATGAPNSCSYADIAVEPYYYFLV